MTSPSDSPLYSVHNWDALFENKESRKIKFCRYVYTPNKQDGSGYGRMMAHPEGEKLFGAWNAIIQVASKMPVRGVLQTVSGTEEGEGGKISRTNLTAEDIAYRTRFKPETMRLALAFFSSREVGWLEREPRNLTENESGGAMPGKSPASSPDFPIEGNGIELEQKRRKDKEDIFSPEGDDGMPKKNVVQQSLIPQPLLEDPGFMEAWEGFLQMRKENKKPATDYAQKLLLRKLEGISQGDIKLAIAILDQSVVGSWQDIYPLKEFKPGQMNGHDVSDALITGER